MENNIIKEQVGIDIAKDDFKVCYAVKSANGHISVRGSRTFANSLRGFSEFLPWIAKKRDTTVSIGLTMEATGVYHEALAYFLHAQEGFNVSVVLPNHAKKYGQSLGERSKTDKIDARILAQMGLERELRLWNPVSGKLHELKQLTRERDTIVCARTAAANTLHAYKHQGKKNEQSIKRTTGHISFLDVQIKEIEKEIEELIKADEVLKKTIHLLESIPGVGWLTAAIVLAETNGFADIHSIKQLTAYSGLDPKIAESGMWKGKSRISKCGNKHIRKAMYMPSLSNVRYDPINNAFYRRLCNNQKQNMVAMVAVQRKMLGLMYTLWKNNDRYDPNHNKQKKQTSDNAPFKPSFGLPEGQKKVVEPNSSTTQDRLPLNDRMKPSFGCENVHPLEIISKTKKQKTCK
jgi:transposase